MTQKIRHLRNQMLPHLSPHPLLRLQSLPKLQHQTHQPLRLSQKLILNPLKKMQIPVLHPQKTQIPLPIMRQKRLQQKIGVRQQGKRIFVPGLPALIKCMLMQRSTQGLMSENPLPQSHVLSEPFLQKLFVMLFLIQIKNGYTSNLAMSAALSKATICSREKRH